MSNEKIQAGLDKYNATVEKAAAKFPMRQSIPEQGLYTPLDIKDTDYAEDIGFPGVYPYTRGVQPTMYRRAFLDDAYVRRFLHGGGVQQALSLPHRERRNGPFLRI